MLHFYFKNLYITFLIDHISVTYNALKIQHPTAGTMICGDRNSLDENKIVVPDPKFRQILSKNTRKDNRLYTDLQNYYHNPEVIPPVPVDIPGHGVPSDHNGVLTLPLSTSDPERKEKCKLGHFLNLQLLN